MKRRKILKYTALMTGSAVGAPLIATILSGCKSGTDTVVDLYEPTFFNEIEFSLIKNLVDVILPKTDSPSASEVGVHRTIDTMVGTVYKAEDKADYKKEITAFFEHLAPTLKDQDQDFSAFLKLGTDEKLAALQTLSTTEDENLADAKNAFMNLRQQTVAYYLSTEEIGTKFLNYLPVPGEYEACITLESVGGKAWAI